MHSSAAVCTATTSKPGGPKVNFSRRFQKRARRTCPVAFRASKSGRKEQFSAFVGELKGTKISAQGFLGRFLRRFRKRGPSGPVERSTCVFCRFAKYCGKSAVFNTEFWKIASQSAPTCISKPQIPKVSAKVRHKVQKVRISANVHHKVQNRAIPNSQYHWQMIQNAIQFHSQVICISFNPIGRWYSKCISFPSQNAIQFHWQMIQNAFHLHLK